MIRYRLSKHAALLIFYKIDTNLGNEINNYQFVGISFEPKDFFLSLNGELFRVHKCTVSICNKERFVVKNVIVTIKKHYPMFLD